jgi:hypothetical protein
MRSEKHWRRETRRFSYRRFLLVGHRPPALRLDAHAELTGFVCLLPSGKGHTFFPASLREASRINRFGRNWAEGEFSSILASPLGFLPSLDQLGRPREYLRRNGQTDLLSRFQIDNQLKLRRLLHRQIDRLGSL